MNDMSNASLRRFLGLMGWIFLLPNAPIALGALWLMFTGISVVGDMRSAEGRVVAHQPVQQYAPRRTANLSVVDFVAHDGRKFSFVDSLVRRNAAEHTIGEKVTVRYPANDPSQAKIGSSAWFSTIFGGIVLTGSSVCMLLGWLMLRFRPKATTIAATH